MDNSEVPTVASPTPTKARGLQATGRRRTTATTTGIAIKDEVLTNRIDVRTSSGPMVKPQEVLHLQQAMGQTNRQGKVNRDTTIIIIIILIGDR